jgi:hypothetical protein
MDDKIKALFQNVKNLLEENDYNPEEFDRKSLAIEIEDNAYTMLMKHFLNF